MSPEANAASIALFDGDRVLLIKRALPPYPHFWTLPGGRREPGETARQCALRELTEEVGLTADDPVEVVVQHFVGTTGVDWWLAVFATRRFMGDITASEEVAGYRWVTLTECAELPTTEGLVALLEKAMRLLDGR